MDLEGFEAAAVPHMNALYDAALRLAGDQATAQDLTQETYLRALRSFDTFAPGTNCRAWLLRIQYNLFCTQYRRGRRMPLIWLDEGETDPSLDLPSPEPGPEEQTVRQLDREAVRRAIAELPEDFRLTVTLVDIHGLTCAEAATTLGVPRGTVLSRLHRARRRLEAMLLPQLGRVQADDL
ncbi:MAG TPA: sigma-70 family RNA polymerase sigma factor [Actinomycetota bacterium]|nr:sigma-70 family RNA polymerase sigma factor [Actinomycetota bacterium]